MQKVDHQFWARERDRWTCCAEQRGQIRGALPRFTMAFQPIMNVACGTVYGYEALVRSPLGESAGSVLQRVPGRKFHLFDKACRSRALMLSMQCGLLNVPEIKLCINMNPNAGVREASKLKLTCDEALEIGFPLDRLVIEIVEDEEICNLDSLKKSMDEYRAMGLQVAMDDFGAGYAGLKMLTKLQPDIVKLDMGLVNQIGVDRTAGIILKAVIQACQELNIEIIAEGVESHEPALRLRELGVVLQQGYYYARPLLEHLPGMSEMLPQPLIG